MQHGYDKDTLKKRLHRIEGQVRGLGMVDEDRYCIDILTQISAVNTLWNRSRSRSSMNMSATASRGALTSGDKVDAETKTEELLAAVQRFARTR